MFHGNAEVERFIDEFLSRHNENSSDDMEALRKQFMDGYCFYFAHILKSAFNRGDVCWIKGISHIVWRDIDGLCYDIEGVYYNYPINSDDDSLIDEKNIPEDELKLFKHL